MSSPSQKTIKRLFAVSGNRCAYPGCNVPLVDPQSGTVTGEICHVKAQNVGGPRYDASQTDLQRHDFSNLILMCPTHHALIDSNTNAFSVDNLLQMKREHEAQCQNGYEPSDDIADQLLQKTGVQTSIIGNSINNGSIIVSTNQFGGQIAHQITNVGPPPRFISGASEGFIVTKLQSMEPETVQIEAIMGDAEANMFADRLEGILKHAGWKVKNRIQAVYYPIPMGVIIIASTVTPSIDILAQWFIGCGMTLKGSIEDVPTTRIIVGAKGV